MNSRRHESILVIFDGGVAALVATILAERPERSVAWIPPEGAANLDAPSHAVGAEAHAAAAQTLASLLGMKGVERPMRSWCGPGQMPAHLMLWQACRDAMRLGCESVLWPVIAGHDPGMLAEADETASLAARLAWLSEPGWSDRAPDICVPLADLTREQVADLGMDLDAPFDGVWWKQAAESQAASDPLTAAAAQEAKSLWDVALRDAARRRGYAEIAP